jgi:hypothetical protein
MQDRVPNQRIVPFVEDHRNLLILTPIPVGSYTAETMATLQAALKRGIEMTFQIEESELVAEPLPKQDERKGILFYEAAEGGAGVLTRLASEPQSLAQAAANALKLMHFSEPQGPWQLEQLDSLEQRDQHGQHQCEAGCYQCLLSYYNQPDHAYINRRDTDSLRLLVALANAQVVKQQFSKAQPGASPTGNTDDKLQRWLATLSSRGLQPPDATAVAVHNGEATAAGQYKGARTLVFLEQISGEVRDALIDKGWQLLDFSNPEHWAALFSQHSAIFGDPA